MVTTPVIFAAAAVVASQLGLLESPTRLQERLTASPTPKAPLEMAQQITRSGQLTTRFTGSWVNMRAEPTVRSQIQGIGRSGDDVTILDQTDGTHDNYQWYLVQIPQSRIQGWVRGDLITERTAPMPEAGTSQQAEISEPDGPGARRSPARLVEQPEVELALEPPEPSARVAERPVAEPVQEVVVSPLPPTVRRSYTFDEISYFTEIALGSEFGGASQRVRKWDEDIRIRVHGTPTSADRQTLTSVVNELNGILNRSTAGRVNVEVMSAQDPRQSNVNMYFVHHRDFSRYEPNYQRGNMGFAYVNWNRDRIYRAQILVTSANDITQQERSHLIREELTQSLGLLRDSFRYSDSIFYQGWTSTTAYSDLDRAVIEMLYLPDVQPGMDGRQVEAVLRRSSTASLVDR